MVDRSLGQALPPRLLTLMEVAGLTGRSRRSLSRDVRAGRLRIVRLGRQVRVTMQEYLRFTGSDVEPAKP